MRYSLNAVEVEIDPPVEIARAGGHLWFPILCSLDNGRILCEATVAEDRHQGEWPATLFMSGDKGASWRRALDIPSYGAGAVLIEPGRLLLQPYELWPAAPGDCRNAMARGTIIACAADGALTLERTPVRITDFPRPWRVKGETLYAGTHPTGVRLKDGRLLGTVYGKFEEDARYALCTVTSDDNGLTWRYQAMVADAHVAPEGKEGPNESDIARLPDGRLLCVLRVGMRQAYWMTTSGDEGATWADPIPMPGVGSVLPKLKLISSNIMLLSGGREGVFLWVSTDAAALEWRRIDLLAHHNAHMEEACRYPDGAPTTSYTSMLALSPEEILLCYDRLANGWKAAPGPYGQHNMLFCVRIRVRKSPV